MHSLVYGGFGLALLAISYFNPMAARASGAFLLYTALTVLVVDFAMGWWLTAILVAWGAYWLVRASRGDGIPQPALDRSRSGGERRVQARRTPAGSRT